MPVTSTADHDKETLFTVCTGLITLIDIKVYQNTVWRDPSIYGYNELFDLTESDFSNISFSDLIEIAQKASTLNIDPGSRFAFLTATQNHEELADFYISVKSMSDTPSREIKKFNSRTNALTWLTNN